MTAPVVVIGAGVGGLAAALRLARAGFQVELLEARAEPGGLASAMCESGFTFDAGPYILLDRPGLEWAFAQLGLELNREIALRSVDNVYQVEWPDGTCVRFYSHLQKTAAGFDAKWPESGKRYLNFVTRMERISSALRPMLQMSNPGAFRLLERGAWRYAPFLMKSLKTVLADAALPVPIQEALSVWTQVAGQTTAEAPSPMAFVPALMHTAGSYYPEGGIATIPNALEIAAKRAGVRFRYSVDVTRIRSESGIATGVETGTGEFIAASAIVSNCSGIRTYLHLLETPPTATQGLKKLPLQSPGVCAYLAVRGMNSSHYLRFRLGEHHEKCRLLIQPAVLDHQSTQDSWFPARLLGPMDYVAAERGGPDIQLEYLDRLLAEEWWQKGFSVVRVLAKRIPHQWGSEYKLYANSMNPVMTARFMRKGRLPHRSPHLRRLYLAGSSTHPGQWVSFCAISGVLAANCLIEDIG